MPILDTGQHGSIHYTEQDIFVFPLGLPGFESEQRFLVLEQPDHAPLVVLQSVGHPGLSFLTLPARALVPDYTVPLTGEDRTLLELDGATEPLLLALLAVAHRRTTANLLSPVVLNPAARRGLQVIPAESAYAHDHLLYEEASC